MTLAALVEQHRVEIESTWLRCGPPDGPEWEESGNHRVEMDQWRVTLRHDGRKITTVFMQGVGWDGAEPRVLDVLEVLCSEVAGLRSEPRFEGWAQAYGYDTDSRRAEAIYHAVEAQQGRLAYLLGPLMDEFVEADRD